MHLALLETNLPLPNKRSGKVRDLYDIKLPDGQPGLLIVATDRTSAFDVVMENGLPGKGIVLTQLSTFWFRHFEDEYRHHLVSVDSADIPDLSEQEQKSLTGRVMICRKTRVMPIECIARGYLAGSGWKDYQATGMVCGIELPKGLRNGDRLEHPLFTPSTKAASGHDENISFDEGSRLIGIEAMSYLRDTTVSLYGRARDYASKKGIILADTKFEFGVPDGEDEPILIDEIFTPDSSRFWPADEWKPGGEQPSFDKQYVRNYLESLVEQNIWNKNPPGPYLPEHIVRDTMARYCEAYVRLTGEEIDLKAYGY